MKMLWDSIGGPNDGPQQPKRNLPLKILGMSGAILKSVVLALLGITT
jgi:hypothetical protein